MSFKEAVKSACLAAMVSASLMATSVLAGPLSDAAAKAEQMAAAGDGVGARSAMRDAISEFSAGLPFQIGKATFVLSEPTGFGMFDPRPDTVFKPGEKIVAYVEPVGLTWKPAQASGKAETRFTVDFDLLDAGGAVLGSQKAFGDFGFTGFTRNEEIFATLTLDVSQAPVGNYVLRYRFNDTNGGKTTSVDLPFSIAAAP